MGDDPRLNQDEIDALLAEIPGDDTISVGGGDDAGAALADAGAEEPALDGLEDVAAGGDDFGALDTGDDLAGMLDDEPAAPAPRPQAKAATAAAPAAMNFSADFSQKNIEVLLDVPLEVVVELGRSEMPIQNILELGPGSIVELNRLSGEPINVLVNGKLVAKGEVVVVDENFGIKITHIISPLERLTQLN